MKIFDFRSDTVTKPSQKMWDAIKNLDNSNLGDDVEREDPTVNKLEIMAAKIVGKESALFVVSGTMGNLLSVLSQTQPGDEVLLEENSHIFKWEVGGVARLGGLLVKTYPSNHGELDPFSLSKMIRPRDDYHQPFTKLICMENTHNYYGGLVLPPSQFASTREFADQFDLKFHIDGARIFNAAVSLGIDVKRYTQYVDSVQFCLSKGLSCPIGSIIAGSSEFIEKARKFRKMVGGGWRQAGIIAAMGVEALDKDWIKRLSVDHDNAKVLAKGISEIDKVVTVPTPQTNIVMINVHKPKFLQPILQDLEKSGILSHEMGSRIRLVTHSGLNIEDINAAIPLIQNVLKKYL